MLWVSSAKNVNIDELRDRIRGWLADPDPLPTEPPTPSPSSSPIAAPRTPEIDPATGEYDDEDEWN